LVFGSRARQRGVGESAHGGAMRAEGCRERRMKKELIDVDLVLT
jgi:hypothetical protein